MTNVPPAPYQVEYLRNARVEMRRCSAHARRLGISRQYLATMRRIHERLTTNPQGWGEPFRRYRAAKLFLRKMIFDRILVVFAVHEEEPVVFVTECRPILGQPLQSP